jgi:transcriptional regulator with XRE-family HTH domain
MGRVIEDLREGVGISRATLARAAGIDPGTLTRIESGERINLRFETVCRIASALGVSADTIAAQTGYAPGHRAGKSRGSAERAKLLDGLDAIESSLVRLTDRVKALRRRA